MRRQNGIVVELGGRVFLIDGVSQQQWTSVAQRWDISRTETPSLAKQVGMSGLQRREKTRRTMTGRGRARRRSSSGGYGDWGTLLAQVGMR